MKNIIGLIKSLPEGSTLDLMDAEHRRFKVFAHMEENRIDGSKGITLLIEEEDNSPKNYTYNLKHLDGIQILSRFWKRYKEDLFTYCCNSEDDRWQDDDFRRHMYSKYFNTDRPITDQLFNLDQDNLMTLMRFIDEELTKGINPFREVKF